MRMTQTTRLMFAATILGAGLVSGCGPKKDAAAQGNPFEGVSMVAVAPVLNFSGDFSVDPIKAADLLASELAQVEGWSVLPVNRVVAAMAREGKAQIESPSHALAVAEAVGAHAIIVAGITEYDAYTPVVGVVMQMYVVPRHGPAVLDAVAASRMARPLAIVEMADASKPCAQVQKVYNGTHKAIAQAVRSYAKPRSDDANPLGWQQYLKVQSLYLRFCWHDAVERLMNQERTRQMVADAGDREPSR